MSGGGVVRALLLGLAALGAGCREARERPETGAAVAPQTIRCAIIGGMVETGLWPELAERFTRLTGHQVQVVATGPKPVIIDAFRQGGVELIAVHASDAAINLVADGLAADAQPWARNDFLIVGPRADPAQIRGQTDALAAMRAIIATRSPVVIQASLGADGVLHDLLEAGKLTLPAEAMLPFGGSDQRSVVAFAAARGAYTIVGRIPFLNGKMPRHGLEIMVQGDARLRRPYLVAVARGEGSAGNAAPAAGATRATRGSDAQRAAARELAAFLRTPATQEWIAAFGKGRHDAAPLFFPVTVP
jgi:tungstate transport system substrate-binding protein